MIPTKELGLFPCTELTDIFVLTEVDLLAAR